MPTKARLAKMLPEEKQTYTLWARKWKQANRDKWNAYQRQYTPTEQMLLKKRLRAEQRHERLEHCAFTDELTLLVHEEAISLRRLRNNTTGFEWHVDHIEPLKGKDVCGLHIWSNLQVIPKTTNLQKGIKRAISN